MLNTEKTPGLMYEGIIYLLAKSNDTKDPKKNRPITCLSAPYKLLTSVLTDRTYSHLEQNYLSPLRQKGCRWGSYGCKDKLMTNKMILGNYKKRKRNLSCAWIDYKKAFDSVPHEWILTSLELFKLSPRVKGFLKHKIKNWKTQLTLYREQRVAHQHQKGDLTGRLFIPTTILHFTHTSLIRAEFLVYGYKNSTDHPFVLHG